MQKDFHQFIEKHGLIRKGDTVFVAVSGGIDSMVLLDLLIRSAFDVTVAHVNFELRGDESDEDEKFVMSRCESHGVKFLSRRVATNNYATDKGVSTQMAARELRYQWFAELTSKGGVLATAHHLNDSGETMLMNLIRGTGIDGLTGIPIRSGSIVRPLAFATRADIEAYAAEQRITWREDESNFESHYQRNFLRHNVMNVLREINPSLDETLERNRSRLGGERELVERSVRDWKNHFITEDNGTLLIRKDGLNGFIHKSGVLLRMIEPFGFNFATAESIVDIMDGQPGKKFTTATHQLTVDREHLIISSLTKKDRDEVVIEHPQLVTLNSVSIDISVDDDLSVSKDPMVATLDAGLVSFPLTWRYWKEGDAFQPFGMNGRKKLSDFLIDIKSPLNEKETVSVITSGDEIIWIVGKRIDDRFKIGAGTKKRLTITVRRP